jgi:ABC-2 type transport system permease protein
MLRRYARRALRYPAMTAMLVGLPVIIMLLFVYVFGGTLGDGLGAPSGGRAAYINYLTPGILLFAIGSAATGTAVSVAMDMTEGIIARFKTMAIFRPSVLTGHVVGSVVQTMVGAAAILGVALLIGFRPNATAIEWVAATGILVAISLAVTWLSVALGLVSKTVEGASNLPMPLTLLPFLGSGFVPTDSMPTALRFFADYQPFTPVTETLRGLLLGPGIGSQAWIALAWCAAITVVGYVWARWLYNRDPSR